MDLSKYQSEAQNTKSPQFYGGAVSKRVFIERVYAAIAALQNLDHVKKALFYNKPAVGIAPEEFDPTCFTLQIHKLGATPEQGIDLIHAIVGKATEASELLEAMMVSLSDAGPSLDHVNIIEEIGDGFWYDAIALEAVGSTFENAASRNNRKLRTRFPNRFTEQDALTRDLFAERQQLEGGTSTVLNGILEDLQDEERKRCKHGNYADTCAVRPDAKPCTA